MSFSQRVDDNTWLARIETGRGLADRFAAAVATSRAVPAQRRGWPDTKSACARTWPRFVRIGRRCARTGWPGRTSRRRLVGRSSPNCGAAGLSSCVGNAFGILRQPGRKRAFTWKALLLLPLSAVLELQHPLMQPAVIGKNEGSALRYVALGLLGEVTVVGKYAFRSGPVLGILHGVAESHP